MYRVVNYKRGTFSFSNYSQARLFQQLHGGKLYVRVASCHFLA